MRVVSSPATYPPVRDRRAGDEQTSQHLAVDRGWYREVHRHRMACVSGAAGVAMTAISELGQLIETVGAIHAGDEGHVAGKWRQFDLQVEGQACPARVIAALDGRDLIEYAVMADERIVRTGLRWDEQVQRDLGRAWQVKGADVGYDRFTVSILTKLAAAQVQWIGRPEGFDDPVPRPKLQLDDRACVRQLAGTGPAPVPADVDAVRPFVISDRGAATVLTAWTGEPVIVHWSDRRTWRGLMAQVGEAGSHRIGLLVQRVSDDTPEAPVDGDHVDFDVTEVKRVYNLSRDSNLVNLQGKWDYRPSLASTTRKVPLSDQVHRPYTQDDVDCLVETVCSGGQVEVSTEEIVTRLLDGGLGNDTYMGETAHWLLHEDEDEESEDEEEDVGCEDDTYGTPLFIYSLTHRDGRQILIAVRTNSWSSFDGGPSWYDYDERIYRTERQIRSVYRQTATIEVVG
jgi:hypothetical protein